MQRFTIQGGQPLSGRTRVSGSKNAALPIMAACLALRGQSRLTNIPRLVDVRTLSRLLQTLGADLTESPGALTIETRDDTPHLAEYELVRQMRAGICVLGPLLARRGRGVVSLPGGCNIGHRPVDLHLRGLSALGAQIDVRQGYIHATAKKLRGAHIHLGGPLGSTVTGTCNVLTAAALASGRTIIEAAACEPEVTALADFLNAAGARITGQGTSVLEIHGVDELQAVDFEIPPDRIEAATLLLAAVITRGTLILEHAPIEHLGAVLSTLHELGATTREIVGPVPALAISAAGPLRPIHASALPYPGLPTDVQAQLMACLCTIPGASSIRDNVFPERFMHVSELCRMGANISLQGNTALVRGTDRLSGAQVMASDLRASAALVLAGLAAEGETRIKRIYHLDRGYEQLEVKLRSLGAQVVREQDADAIPARRAA